MIVTIVAKTHQGSSACVGGIAEDGRSVRLIASDAAFNEHHNLEYEVGQRWEIDADPPEEIIPPHVENIVVRRKRPLPPEHDLPALIAQHMPIYHGGPEVLYEGGYKLRPAARSTSARAVASPPTAQPSGNPTAP